MMKWQFGLNGKYLNLKHKKPLKLAVFADAGSTPVISTKILFWIVRSDIKKPLSSILKGFFICLFVRYHPT